MSEKTDDCVEWCSKFVAHIGQELALRPVRLLRGAARLGKGGLLRLSEIDVAGHRHDAAARCRIDHRPAAHLDPGEAGGFLRTDPQAELGRDRFAGAIRLGESPEECRTVADQHALEEALPEEIGRRAGRERPGSRRGEGHVAIGEMPGDEIGRVVGEQAVAIIAEPRRGARLGVQGLDADRDQRGIENGAGNDRRTKGRLHRELCRQAHCRHG